MSSKDASRAARCLQRPFPSLIYWPIVIAVVFNAFLYGIVTLHYVQYSLGSNKDGISMKLMVNFLVVVDTVHTASSVYMLWYYAVANFSNLSVLVTAPWPFTATPIWTVLCSLPVQHLFSWRIKQFTHSWYIFGILSFFWSLLVEILCHALIGEHLSDSIDNFHKFIPIADTWLAVAVACDLLIAGLLFYHLMKSKTGFRNTDTVISRLIRSSVETTAISAFFCVRTILGYVMQGVDNGQTLNSRTSLREELIGTAPTFLGGDRLGQAFQISERMKPTEVAIAVEQEIQMDSYSGTPPSRSSSKRNMDLDDREPYSFTPL
ncbi:hypothetical protein A0H81_05146 [Grifola frondosa]|uniref:DUF6534 domain-containing protein n=1 Tax=Grifola frondosa TaxID=5627 RepID=A0A1C7MEN9_GRIFR|nr:hypothetical protein A0H81_05146 [Grifola frondosa]